MFIFFLFKTDSHELIKIDLNQLCLLCIYWSKTQCFCKINQTNKEKDKKRKTNTQVKKYYTY